MTYFSWGRRGQRSHAGEPAQSAAQPGARDDGGPAAPDRVLAHSDIAPGRKRDPGEKFDWQRLAHAGIGLWVAPAPPGSDQGLGPGDEGESVAELQRALLVEQGVLPLLDLMIRVWRLSFLGPMYRAKIKYECENLSSKGGSEPFVASCGLSILLRLRP